jgi:hypothetical protein
MGHDNPHPVVVRHEYCPLCDKYYRWKNGCDDCKKCYNERKKREEEARKERERKRKEEEEEEEKRREIERKIKEIEAEKERVRKIKEIEEKAEEKARNNLSSLLNSISYKVSCIYLDDIKINTSMINKKSIYLNNKRVNNLYCSMSTVGSANSESIDTTLKRERVYEQKSNYLYKETDELGLENLKTLNTSKKKIQFLKKF